MLRLLITGGLGFIGSNFIRYILNKYPTYHITNLDKLTYAGNPDNLKDIENNPNYTFQFGDVCIVEEVMMDYNESFDWIINFAADTHVDRSIENSYPFTKTNYLGTQKLLDYAKKINAKFFQISTDEIYGDLLPGQFANENFPLFPSSPYSSSKAAADLLIQAYHRTFSINYIISRSSNNFGPYQYPEKLIPLAITNLIRAKKIPVYGDGLQIRDWLYVEENCKALDLLLHKGRLNQIYNIGSGNQLTNLDLISMILKIMKIGKNKIEFVKDRLGHDRRYALNCDKIRGLGFNIKYDLERYLEQTIQWYKDNKDWWEKLIK